MATTAQMYYEIARILRVTRNNVEYEAERNKSQLLCDVAKTLGNLSTLVENISTDIRALELSHKKGYEDDFMAYLKEREKGYKDDFMAYLKERENKSGSDFIMKRFTTQL